MITERRFIIEVVSTEVPQILINKCNASIDKISGSYIDISTDSPAVAAYISSSIGNINRVICVNGVVIKSFDNNYLVGEIVGWFSDYTTIKID